MFVKRDPVQIKLISNVIVRTNRSFEHRSVSDIKSEPSRLQTLTSLFSLTDALLIKRDINPSCEAISFVP
jgi:hypothetical protein